MWAKALVGTVLFGLTFGIIPGLLLSRGPVGLLIGFAIGGLLTAATWRRVSTW